MKTLLATAILAAVIGGTDAKEPAPDRHFSIETRFESFDGKDTFRSYRSGTRGSGSVGSTIGAGSVGKDHPIDVWVRPLRKDKRLLAEVTLDQAGGAEPRVETLDLTDLRPVTLDLTDDDDGRHYQVTLSPSIVITETRPQPFSEAGSDLYKMQFHHGMIVMNDRRYVGRMSASNTECASLDVCDVASIEFSLYHLKDAEPWGTLKGGQLLISNPDTGEFFEFNGVTNGPDKRVVPGGPYQVWVRWKDPTRTCEELRAAMLEMKQKVEAGDFSGDPGMASRIEAALARPPGPWVVGSGARGVRPSELVAE